MAQGNLFKGKSKGSIGDVTFSTQAGQQISRVRNRHPRNPRTNTQMFQRAIWATIVQAYSYGKEFFGTAFESAQTKRQNQTAFMSVNMNYLRELITEEIDNNTPLSEQRGRVVHPNSYTPVPIEGLTVSQGTLEDKIFTIAPATENSTMFISMPTTASDKETIAEYAERIGLTNNTTYTMLVNIVDTNINILYPQQINSQYAINYQSYFATAQLTYTAKNGSKTIASATLGDIFNISYTGQIFPYSMKDVAFGYGRWPITTLLRQESLIGTFAISAYNNTTQQTTTATMKWMSKNNAYGIASKYIFDIWGKQEQKQYNQDMTQEQRPFDYKIEYIEATGTQFINIERILNPNTIDITAMSLSTKNDNLFVSFGTIWDWPNYRLTTNGNLLLPFSNTAFEMKNYNDKFRIVRRPSSINIYINDTLVRTQIPDGQPSERTPLALFNAAGRTGIGRIYQIYIDNKLKLIPVMKDGKPCLYDEISEAFYYNRGTGDFIAGPRIY